MRNVFATTFNVEKFQGLTKRLEGRNENVPGMGLIFGPPGLGKTKTAMWYAAKSGAVYIRAKAAMTVRWLLQEIVEGLDEAPYYRTSNLYAQARDRLSEHPRLVIIDEVDHLASDRRVIETVRDLHDESKSGFLLIGMHESERKLKRFRHLYDRVRAHVMEFRPVAAEDLADVARQLCEVELSECAVNHIAAASGGKFREIIIHFYNAEYAARMNGISRIEAKHLKGKVSRAVKPAPSEKAAAAGGAA